KIQEQDVKIQEQDVKIQQQEKQILKLEKDITVLKERDTPLTIREAISILENHMMVKIVGSKRQAKRYYGIYDLSQRNDYKTIYDKYLQDNNITQDHIDLMLELKEDGNNSAHAQRPSYNKNEWKIMLIDCLDNPQNQQDIKMIDDIMLLMEKYNPPSDPWIMKKP
ncbi:MAG: hypothetical protein Gaeavirus2_28, partial [Gaeavirus sp.]